MIDFGKDMPIMIEQIYETAQNLVRDAGRMFIDVADNKMVTIKDGTSNFATMIDYRVQEYMVNELEHIIPGSNIITEESSSNIYNLDRPTWILDPVDGTINISHDFKYSAISLALFLERRPVLGIVYNPYLDEMFHARCGRGAFLGSTPISASKTCRIRDSLITFGTTPYDRSKAERTFSTVEQVFLNCQDIRRSGSAALDISYIACGRTEGFFELCLQPWDYAAGMLILLEAGGQLTDWQGNKPDPLKPSAILATNGLIHGQMMDILKRY